MTGKRVVAILPADVRDDIRRFAASEGMTMSAWMGEAIMRRVRYLRRKEWFAEEEAANPSTPEEWAAAKQVADLVREAAAQKKTIVVEIRKPQ